MARRSVILERYATSQELSVDWYDITGKYHELTFDHDCDLESLPEEWQRELAAVWRLEADVNNGGYLQFFTNWGADSYRYGLAALRKIGAKQMAMIIEDCHATLSAAVDIDNLNADDLNALMPNPMIGPDGQTIKEAGSTLPDSALNQIYDLSYRFMDYPEDLPELGLSYYKSFVTSQSNAPELRAGRFLHTKSLAATR